MTLTISVLLFPDFSNLCLANAVEPLRAANALSRKTLYNWRFLGVGDGPVLSSSRLPVAPDMQLARSPGGDLLFVMPSYGWERFATPGVLRSLRAAARRFGTLVGLDTGSLLLASAGLLEGRRATSHWDVLVEFEERFPEVSVVTDRFVIDGDRASCGGATTTLELMLDFIRRHHGAMLSLEVSSLFMHGERNPALDYPLRLPEDQIVRAAAAIMRRHIEEPLSIVEIARRLGVNQRSLEMRCAGVAGRTPKSIYSGIRLSEAYRLAEQTKLTIAEIAGRVGYRDASAMTRAFKAEFGRTPASVRGKRGV